MSTVERVEMCLAEAGFVRGRDYADLYADEDDPDMIHMSGYFYIHDAEPVSAALRRATDLVRQARLADPKERRAV